MKSMPKDGVMHPNYDIFMFLHGNPAIVVTSTKETISLIFFQFKLTEFQIVLLQFVVEKTCFMHKIHE